MTDQQDLEQLRALRNRFYQTCPQCQSPSLQEVKSGEIVVMQVCPHCGYTKTLNTQE